MQAIVHNTTTVHAYGPHPANLSTLPVGGGPGMYPGGYPWTANKVVRTVDEFLACLDSYRHWGILVTNDSPSPDDTRIFIPGDVRLNLTGISDMRVPEGVDILSDRGLEITPGSYSPGALLYNDEYWWTEGGLCQEPFLSGMGDNQIEGLRLRGPGSDFSVVNANDRTFGATGIKMPKHATGPVSVCNLKVSHFGHCGIWIEWGYEGTSIDNTLIEECLTQGYGYGIWIGRAVTPGAKIYLDGVHTRHCRHHYDGRGYDGTDEEKIVVERTNFVEDGVSRNQANNVHSKVAPNGTRIGMYSSSMKNGLVVVTAERWGQSYSPIYGDKSGAPPEGGLLRIRDVYQPFPKLLINGVDALAVLDPDSEEYDPNWRNLFSDPVGEVDIRAGNPTWDWYNLLPGTEVVAGQNGTAGEPVKIQFNADLPFRWYEIHWGDGSRSETGMKQAEHIYNWPGVYTITVIGRDVYGIPSRFSTTVLHQQPESRPGSKPILTFWYYADWPQPEDLGYDIEFWLDDGTQIIGSTVYGGGWHLIGSEFEPNGNPVRPKWRVVPTQNPVVPAPVKVSHVAIGGLPSAYRDGHWLSVCDGTFGVPEYILKKQWGNPGTVYHHAPGLGGGSVLLRATPTEPAEFGLLDPLPL